MISVLGFLVLVLIALKAGALGNTVQRAKAWLSAHWLLVEWALLAGRIILFDVQVVPNSRSCRMCKSVTT